MSSADSAPVRGVRQTFAMRNLILVLGDQLDAQPAAFDGFDPKRDVVWITEVTGEAAHVWSHKARIAIFLAGMRHCRDDLRGRGVASEAGFRADDESSATAARRS